MMHELYSAAMMVDTPFQACPPKSVLEGLPTEILDQICSSMRTNSDVKSFRLVCRRFDAIASKIILRNVHLDHFQESFDRLLTISKHPVFSHHVRTITYIPSLFISCLSLGDFRQACKVDYDNQRGFRGITYKRIDGLSPELIKRYYDQYQERWRAQRLLLASSRIYAILSRACLQLPRLEEIVVYRGISRHMATVLTKTLVPPIIGVKTSSSHTVSLLRAAGLGQVKLKKLRLDWLQRSFFDKPISRDLRIQSSLKQLRSLNAIVYVYDDPDDTWRKNFTEFLKLCSCLQNLELVFYFGLRMGVVVRQEMILGGQLCWPDLESLTLKNVTLKEVELAKFVIARQQKLSRIHLINCPFEDCGSWSSLYQRLKPHYLVSFSGFGEDAITVLYVSRRNPSSPPAKPVPNALSLGLLKLKVSS